MNRLFTIAMSIAAVSATVAAQEEAVRDDLLRFSNGDQLHGSFAGIAEGPKLLWERADVKGPMELSPSQVRQIVLGGGRPKRSLPSLSYVALVNGDRVPGTLVSLDEKNVILDTSFAGEVVLARQHVAMVAPNPLGGRLVYHGPFQSDEWSMVNAAAEQAKKDEPRGNEDGPGQKAGNWGFAGAAWYWQGGRPGTALVRKEGMPERSVLRFHVAWKSRLAMAVAFHADFKQPDPKEGEDEANPRLGQFSGADPSFFSRLFGNSYVIQINGNSVMLYRTGFDENGKQVLDAIRASSYSARFTETDRAEVEIRCSRQSGEISLFINGEFVSQWNEGLGEGEGYIGAGSGFGFLVQGQNTPVRISEIAMAEWNGMPDSARSLQLEDQDIVLLANGTDRLSGKVTGFKDGTVTLEGKYGAFRLPVDDLAEIRFAKARLAKAPEASEDQMLLHLYPLGRVTGKPVTGAKDRVRLATPFAGEWEVKLDSTVILDFNPASSFLDDWDVQF